MSRYFQPITLDEFKTKFCGHDLLDYAALSPVAKDLSKVKFDNENFCGPNTNGFDNESHKFGPAYSLIGWHVLPNGMPIAGCAAGGDWELPVFFIMYWDGKKIRGYVPENGNPWNTDTKQAYGNDETSDLINVKKRWPHLVSANYEGEVDVEGDAQEITEDIMNRITLKPDKPTKFDVTCYTDGSVTEYQITLALGALKGITNVVMKKY